MNKTIHTLVTDIEHLLTQKDGWFTEELSTAFAHSVASRLHEQYSPRGPAKLRLSRMGPQCPCALWYSIHHPELASKLPPWAENMYSYGHIIETWALTLARASGHRVEGEQDELSVDGVLGHRDCVIDGCLLDVKSCSKYTLKALKDGSFGQDDLFGYLDQLDGYMCGSLGDDLVQVKDKAYILGIDKHLGHMALYEHEFTEYRKQRILSRISEYKNIVGRHSDVPECTCKVKPYGEAGNLALDTKASYNLFKHSCADRRGETLRTFIYSDGPVYLTKVVKRPRNKFGDILELDRYGRPVS